MSEAHKVEEGLFYTEDHEWARKLDDGMVLIGITDYAQAQLHEVVYVELPEVEAEITKGEAVGAVESVKAVSDMNSPVSGRVVEVNEELLDSPEKINDDPYGEGWIAKIEPSSVDADLEGLMDAAAYTEHMKTASH